MNISTRIGTEADLPAVAQFWSEHSGWGEMDLAAWQANFGTTPQGPAELILAEVEDTGEMVGQFVFLPIPVAIKGQQVSAYRPFAPIVKSDLRMRDDAVSLQGVMLQMYMNAVEHLSQLGAELLYILPDPRWARIFSFAPFFLTGTFPLYSMPLVKAATLSNSANLRAVAIDFGDARINELWQQNKQRYDCLILRDQVFLQWKNSHRAYQLWAVVDQDEKLVGAFVSLRKIQQKQCLICDVLCSEGAEVFAQVLQTALAFLAQKEKQLEEREAAVEKIALLAIPQMLPTLDELGFAKDQYHFHLVVHALNPELDQALVAPERWYISAND